MLTFYFEKNNKQPKYKQLYQYIREEITSGRMRENEKLPSKRKLAVHLKVSQATIDTAYQQLAIEGYIRAYPKSGFYVERYHKPMVSKKPLLLNEVTHTQGFTYWCDFKTNVVDANLFPHAVWAKLARMVLVEKEKSLLNQMYPQGLFELRVEIAKYLHDFRGINAMPEQIILGAGSESLLGLLIALLGRKKIYALENPGYTKITQIFQKNDVTTIPIDLDEEGLMVSELEKTEANIVHLTPSHQFPLGVVMPVKRRMALLHWANEKNRYIIEDDYDSEFRFSGQPIPALQSLDYAEKVIYINSFTKSLAPSLRINYMVLPLTLTKRFQDQFYFHMCSVPNFEQYILYLFMKEGYFERHLNRMRNAYRLRLHAFLDAMEASALKEHVSFKGIDAGLHFLMTVNVGMDEATLVDTAKASGIHLYGLSQYYQIPFQKVPKNTLVMGYSGLEVDCIQKAVNVLASIWKKS